MFFHVFLVSYLQRALGLGGRSLLLERIMRELENNHNLKPLEIITIFTT